jgi:PAS domain S-box-containing protein
VDPALGTVDVARDWTAPGFKSLAGKRRFIDDRAYHEKLARGEPILFADTERDASPGSAAGWLAVGARAVINVPIFELGDLVAVIYLHAAAPREWLADEITFLRNAAERTRSAVERRRAENELRALNEKLERSVAERTADRNRLWRLSADVMLVAQFDGTIVAVNPAWQSALGWRENEMIGHMITDFMHPDDVRATTQGLFRLSGGLPVTGYEIRSRHRDGSYRWLSWNAVPGGGVVNAVGRDFTAEREKAQALALSEARMRSVFETSFQFLGLLTTEGILVDANPPSLAAIERTLADVAGLPFWETPWFTSTSGMPEQIRAAVPLAACGQAFRQEISLTLPTGQRAFDFSMRPVYDAGGDVIAIVNEAMELTERRLAEEQLRQAQKMEAIGQLTGGLAHDFNNVLTGISGNLELLQMRVESRRFDELARYIEAARRAADRAAAVTHRLLAFARRQTLAPKPVDANRLIADMSALIRGTVGSGVTFETALATDLWTTRCDQNQLESALLNLCINARDAMPGGGSIEIRTANATLDARGAARGDVAPGDYVAISVIDTGIGMAADVVARAFDPFFTTKPPGQGTGLGLSMIYGFVQQSGGQVSIRSRKGAGTAVRMLLPRSLEATA